MHVVEGSVGIIGEAEVSAETLTLRGRKVCKTQKCQFETEKCQF